MKGGPHRSTYTAHLALDGSTVTAVEPEFAQQFGRTPDEMYGRSLSEFLHPISLPALEKGLAGLSANECDRFTERVVGRAGADRTFPADLTGVAVKGTDGGPAGVVVLLRPREDEGGEGTDHEAAAPFGSTLGDLDVRVLEGVASGASTVQLANRLYMSRQGVEYRVALLLRKFQVPNRPALVARAHALGVLSVDQWPPRVPQEFLAPAR
ncbi:PAS domain-containing protein [Streptomyces minutiscleroticus]|uniref:PAS domain-containing protein n=1 Tax=Streptomyces minutiscleroticus TaxID=68238 RepID=UPI0033182E8B